MNIASRQSGRRLALTVVLSTISVGFLGGMRIARAEGPADSSNLNGNVMRGWQTFNRKHCIDCHAIWGEGRHVGPDLGRWETRAAQSTDRSRPTTRDQLAGIMWNHIPKMQARMKQVGQPPVEITATEMSDIFALMEFARQLDDTGDPDKGERILRMKGCSECHSIDTVGGSVGPDLAKWGRYANPIIWAQKMWEHAPMMEQTMKRSGIQWPKLEGADLVHIVAYVRSYGFSGKKKYLLPGSSRRGKDLFTEKKCNQCHPGIGSDLTTANLPTSMSALASRMWNHSPAMRRVMRERDVKQEPITPQELADILSYVLTLNQQDRGGDAVLGRQVFMQKGCAQCHGGEEMSAAATPPLQELSQAARPANMAAAMWNHGESMLDRMTEAGLSWPVFDRNEMADLLAYLHAAQSDGSADAAAGSGVKNAAR